MPASPRSSTTSDSWQACASTARSASRPIRRGGRITAAGTAAGAGGAAALSMVRSSARVSGEGVAPTSCLSMRSQASKASSAAARSPAR